MGHRRTVLARRLEGTTGYGRDPFLSEQRFTILADGTASDGGSVRLPPRYPGALNKCFGFLLLSLKVHSTVVDVSYGRTSSSDGSCYSSSTLHRADNPVLLVPLRVHSPNGATTAVASQGLRGVAAHPLKVHKPQLLSALRPGGVRVAGTGQHTCQLQSGAST